MPLDAKGYLCNALGNTLQHTATPCNTLKLADLSMMGVVPMLQSLGEIPPVTPLALTTHLHIHLDILACTFAY